MKLPFSTPFWFALTVIVPGAVVYGAFRVVVGILDLNVAWLAAIDESEVLTTSVILGAGLLIQVIGITLEDLFFEYGHYRHRGEGDCKRCSRPIPALHAAFQERYVTLTRNPKESSRVEYILAQFFMSQNIAVGFTLIAIWLAIQLHRSLPPAGYSGTLIVALLVVGFAWYVPYNRFHMAAKAVLDFRLTMGYEHDAVPAAKKATATPASKSTKG